MPTPEPTPDEIQARAELAALDALTMMGTSVAKFFDMLTSTVAKFQPAIDAQVALLANKKP
jgi:hypothetical protein